MMALFIFIYYS